MTKLTGIEGIGKVYAQKLEEAGIATTEARKRASVEN